MTYVSKIRLSGSVSEAIKILKSGGAVVYPTDTAYGLGVDATNEKAVKKLYQIKERWFKKPVHVVVSSLAIAKRYVQVSKSAEKLVNKFLPGPLTIILPLKKKIPQAIKMLSAGTGTLGIRMPDNKIALSLTRRLKKPITTPSANLSRGLTPYSVEDSFKQFQNKKHQPDLYLDSGRLKRTKPSTLVKIVDGQVEILRFGQITKKQILAALSV